MASTAARISPSTKLMTGGFNSSGRRSQITPVMAIGSMNGLPTTIRSRTRNSWIGWNSALSASSAAPSASFRPSKPLFAQSWKRVT